ncbi:serine/threonine-protein kinase 40-like [Contarinia nasturtii]|uniref:serine/threonine-protein kinase 40-like n=1 Tax=Contarinia nasturtii TaxID=265458 RepID=UPI0012D4845B|nr:serine/threonine-protein kinase 40-like [Contarinia nasturtii]
MSLMTSEIPSYSETMVITESNKRKFDEIDAVLKKCKLDSPTSTSTFVDEQSNSILTDVTDDNESLASSDHSSDKRMTFATATISDNCDNNIAKDEQSPSEAIMCPMYGQTVNRREFRRAGPYIIGLKLGHSPVDSIVQYLAKKENTNEFVQLKILMLNNNTANEKLQLDERQGKMLLHTEFSLLSLLQNENGVIQQHGLFSDVAHEEVLADNGSNNNFYTGSMRKRLILVLDCVTPHDFDPQSSALVNLQQYLINRKKLTEIEALTIFYEIISVVENLHTKNIIHRDLKLGNIVLNKQTNKITITNFCLGKYLLNENDLLYDQRGSPAYIAPDVLSGKPYKGKPSDMWALGVVLFMMLYRQFPFFESTPAALFKKIKAAEYFIPMNCEISKATEGIIKGLLQLNPAKRLTATQVREQLKAIIDSHNGVGNTDHLVPEMNQTNDNNVAHYPTPPETSHKVKWRNTQTASDQVVPTMTTSNPPSIPVSRKRRRSSDKLLNDISQRGISVQHVASDARHLNANDITRLQHLFRSNRNIPTRLSAATITSSSTASNTTSDQNRSPSIAMLRRLRDVQNNNNNINRSNRTIPQNVSRIIERPLSLQQQQQTNASNTSWQFLRIGNPTLGELYRCAVASSQSRNQQTSGVNRQNDQVRLIRRIRRAWSTNTNNQTNGHGGR